MTEISYSPDQPAAKVHLLLRRSLVVMDDAHQCAVLWFGEVMNRGLFRDMGCSSINQYAVQELGFSKSKAGDFIRLARQLEKLPAVREAVASGELGYTKAREIVSVATPETQESWLEAAKGTRKELVREVKKAKHAAKVDPGQGVLLPSSPPVVAPREYPCALLWILARSRKRGGRRFLNGCTNWGVCPQTERSSCLSRWQRFWKSGRWKLRTKPMQPQNLIKWYIKGPPGGFSPANPQSRSTSTKPRQREK
jgi:hypothetical protein